jgi:hypothetical protein
MLNGAGVLTDRDIARAESVAPTITMARPQFKGQLEAVKHTIRGALETWLQTNAGQATDEQIALAKQAITSLQGTSSKESAPATKETSPSSSPTGMVRMQKPDGSFIRVPADKVEEAKKLGATIP